MATASEDGEPWISPVFFAFDSAHAMDWVSDKEARHSSLIRQNPRVAIVVFNSQAPEGAADTVYCRATVHELVDPHELAAATSVLNARVTQDEFRIAGPGQVTGSGMYRATPISFSKLTAGELVNGQYVDRRVDLGKAPANHSDATVPELLR